MLVPTGSKGGDEVTAIKFAVVIEVSVGPTRITFDIILVFVRSKEYNQVGRIEFSIHVGIAGANLLDVVNPCFAVFGITA